MLNNEIIKRVTTIIKIMKLNCRELWKKFQRDRLNISIQRWIITQYEKRLYEEKFKFIRLFDEGFKIIKNFVLTCMENMIKFKGESSHNIKSDSLRRSLNLSDWQGFQNHQNLHFDPYGKYDQMLHFVLGFLTFPQ